MAKGDVYYLIDPHGYIIAKFEHTEKYMGGNCYSCSSWVGDKNEPYEWDFFAEVWCKWDACTHWRFKGEDYDVENDKEHDSYYHICGKRCFSDHIRLMCFVWKIAPMLLSEYEDFQHCRDSINDWYFETEEIKQLVEMMLTGYTIKKGE